MTEQDWIILRLLTGVTPTFRQLSDKARRDYVKSILYLTDKYGLDVMLTNVDQLKAEA